MSKTEESRNFAKEADKLSKECPYTTMPFGDGYITTCNTFPQYQAFGTTILQAMFRATRLVRVNLEEHLRLKAQIGQDCFVSGSDGVIVENSPV